ncbi:eukaryotic aspartyl protease [Cladorrhinum samala]|uniref:Eukaryotic aspartyl protease n=1 Tax=Cladorrhinum samala TaxID=585594 RepID=A0AAV9HGW0_9PEZI|nr:eukaryotic aspartyl protease [Cladorrhinum samala]
MINSAFDPPARYMPTYNAFFTSCDARTPPGPLAIILNGIKFSFNPRDLIYRNMPDPVTGLCMTAIASGGSQGGPYILGDAFMQNALVVFDLGEAKIRVTGRMRY